MAYQLYDIIWFPGNQRSYLPLIRDGQKRRRIFSRRVLWVHISIYCITCILSSTIFSVSLGNGMNTGIQLYSRIFTFQGNGLVFLSSKNKKVKKQNYYLVLSLLIWSSELKELFLWSYYGPEYPCSMVTCTCNGIFTDVYH